MWILIVDDDPADLLLIERTVRLQFGPCNVVTVSSGIAAMNAVEHRHFNIGLVDASLGQEDGRVLAEDLRRTGKVETVSVMSGLALPNVIDKDNLSDSLRMMHGSRPDISAPRTESSSASFLPSSQPLPSSPSLSLPPETSTMIVPLMKWAPFALSVATAAVTVIVYVVSGVATSDEMNSLSSKVELHQEKYGHQQLHSDYRILEQRVVNLEETMKKDLARVERKVDSQSSKIETLTNRVILWIQKQQ